MALTNFFINSSNDRNNILAPIVDWANKVNADGATVLDSPQVFIKSNDRHIAARVLGVAVSTQFGLDADGAPTKVKFIVDRADGGDPEFTQTADKALERLQKSLQINYPVRDNDPPVAVSDDDYDNDEDDNLGDTDDYGDRYEYVFHKGGYDWGNDPRNDLAALFDIMNTETTYEDGYLEDVRNTARSAVNACRRFVDHVTRMMDVQS